MVKNTESGFDVARLSSNANKLDLFFNIAVSVELGDVSPQIFDLLLVLNTGETGHVAAAPPISVMHPAFIR